MVLVAAERAAAGAATVTVAAINCRTLSARRSSAATASFESPTLNLLPGVRFGGLAARPGPDRIEPRQALGRELELHGAQAAVQLLARARPDDRSGDGRIAEQPRERDVGRALTELSAESLVRLDPRAVLLHGIAQALVSPTTLARLLEGSAEEAATQ